MCILASQIISNHFLLSAAFNLHIANFIPLKPLSFPFTMICYYQSISKKSLLLFFLIYLLPLIPSITVFFLLDCHPTLESPTLLSHFSHLTCKTVLNQYQLAMLLLHPLLFSLAFHKDLFSDLYFSVSTLLLFLTFFLILAYYLYSDDTQLYISFGSSDSARNLSVLSSNLTLFILGSH